MTNPHIQQAEALLTQVTEERLEAVAWQATLLTLVQAQVEATLALAVELKGLREQSG
jgi:hypothetical protein